MDNVTDITGILHQMGAEVNFNQPGLTGPQVLRAYALSLAHEELDDDQETLDAYVDELLRVADRIYVYLAEGKVTS